MSLRRKAADTTLFTVNPDGCPPDDDRSRERVRYFEGMLLTAADFEQEQAYFRAKARRHNRLLHGWGVAIGLEVSASASSGQVSVSPGYALDPCGNEISIEETVSVQVPKAGRFYLAVRFDEFDVSDRRARDSYVIDVLDEPTEPWVVLAAVTVDDDQAVSIDSSVRRRLD